MLRDFDFVLDPITFWASHFGFHICDFTCWTSHFGFRILDFTFWISIFEKKTAVWGLRSGVILYYILKAIRNDNKLHMISVPPRKRFDVTVARRRKKKDGSLTKKKIICSSPNSWRETMSPPLST